MCWEKTRKTYIFQRLAQPNEDEDGNEEDDAEKDDEDKEEDDAEEEKDHEEEIDAEKHDEDDEEDDCDNNYEEDQDQGGIQPGIPPSLTYVISRVDAIHGGRSLKVVKLS